MSDSRAGPFVLERPLATRAMGEVWAAVHEPSGAPVALKFLARKHATDPRAVAAFRAEARALAPSSIPASCASTTTGSPKGGVPFFAMERAPGGTLADLGARDDVTAILLSLLDALAHVHARGLVIAT
jgi:serine/threonine-protein kinase